MARKVLLDLDDELLERFDRFWPAVGYASRRAAIRHSLEVTLAAHATHRARDQAAAAGPAAWTSQTWTSDDEAAVRPITSDLQDLG